MTVVLRISAAFSPIKLQNMAKFFSEIYLHLILVRLTFDLGVIAKSQPKCVQHISKNNSRWEDVIPANYKQHISPTRDEKPVTVFLSLYPQGIPDVSVEKMTMEVDFYLVVLWSDCRLNLPSINGTVPSYIAVQLWTPMVAVSNGVGSTQMKFDQQNNFISVKDNGLLFFYSRYDVHFYCKFDLTAYPMDFQRCELQVISSLEKNEVILKDYTDSNYIQSLTGKTPPQYIVTGFGKTNCSKDNVFTKSRSCSATYFIMKRPLVYHLIVTYIPSMLIVILSWVSFWLDIDASAPRVTLGLTSLLTLSTQFANTQKNLPPVAYVKAIDVWMFACMFMVFASLIQFAIANFQYRRRSIPLSNPKKPNRNNIYSNKIYIFDFKHPATKGLLSSAKPKPKSPLCDRISRTAFPLGFGLFNLIYWLYYLVYL